VVSNAAIEKHGAIVRLESAGLVKILDGAVVLALVVIRDASEAERNGNVVLRFAARLDDGGTSPDRKVHVAGVRARFLLLPQVLGVAGSDGRARDGATTATITDQAKPVVVRRFDCLAISRTARSS
jgi:hypothetical protein